MREICYICLLALGTHQLCENSNWFPYLILSTTFQENKNAQRQDAKILGDKNTERIVFFPLRSQRQIKRFQEQANLKNDRNEQKKKKK